jgi:repressor LexA
MKLTAKQQAVLDFIREFRQKEGCSPSIPEMQRAFGMKSPNGVVGHLEALEAKGAIRRSQRGSRSIDLVEQQEVVALPLLGLIPAGPPQVSSGQDEGAVAVDVESLGFRPKRGSFALRVRGDSMKDAAILDRDIVVVEADPQPKAGQIVVALIDGESTLKRLVQNKGRWYLKAENSAYPELVPRADLVIQGVVRTVIRQLSE